MDGKKQIQSPSEGETYARKLTDATSGDLSSRRVGGVPEGVPGTLGGMAILLIVMGLLCELYAGRGTEGSWQNVLLAVVLCVLVVALVCGERGDSGGGEAV